MGKLKKIINAKNDSNRNIIAVKLQGNKNFIPLKVAIKMVKNEKIDAVLVKQTSGKEYIRTRPDGKQRNNLDYLAKVGK